MLYKHSYYNAMKSKPYQRFLTVSAFLLLGFSYPNTAKAQLDQEYKQQNQQQALHTAFCSKIYQTPNIVGIYDWEGDKVKIVNGKVWVAYLTNNTPECDLRGILNKETLVGGVTKSRMFKLEGKALVVYIKQELGGITRIGKKQVGYIP